MNTSTPRQWLPCSRVQTTFIRRHMKLKKCRHHITRISKQSLKMLSVNTVSNCFDTNDLYKVLQVSTKSPRPSRTTTSSVYVTQGVRPSVRPSVCHVAAAEELLWHSPMAGNWAVVARRPQPAAWCSAANAGSAMFTAKVHGWTQTCFIIIHS